MWSTKDVITLYYTMSRTSKILSISVPAKLSRAMDKLSKQTAQTRSELVRNAVREYIIDSNEDRERFLEAYKATRGQKTLSLEDLQKKYDLT